TAERTLRPVVVEQQSSVVEEAHERVLLPVRVAERAAERATRNVAVAVLGRDPLEERLGVRPQMDIAEALDLGGRLVPPRRVELEDSSDAREPFARERIFVRGGLPELPAPLLLPWA